MLSFEKTDKLQPYSEYQSPGDYEFVLEQKKTWR